MFKFILWPSRTAQDVFAMVRNRVFKGDTTRAIINAVKERFPRRRESTIQTYIDYARGMMAGARRVNQSGDNRVIINALESTQTSDPQFIRVGYTFEFIDPKTGNRRKAGFELDESPGLTKAELRQAILRKIREWLNKYQFRGSRGSLTQPRIQNMTIRSLEGF